MIEQTIQVITSNTNKTFEKLPSVDSTWERTDALSAFRIAHSANVTLSQDPNNTVALLRNTSSSSKEIALGSFDREGVIVRITSIHLDFTSHAQNGKCELLDIISSPAKILIKGIKNEIQTVDHPYLIFFKEALSETSELNYAVLFNQFFKFEHSNIPLDQKITLNQFGIFYRISKREKELSEKFSKDSLIREYTLLKQLQVLNPHDTQRIKSGERVSYLDNLGTKDYSESCAPLIARMGSFQHGEPVLRFKGEANIQGMAFDVRIQIPFKANSVEWEIRYSEINSETPLFRVKGAHAKLALKNLGVLSSLRDQYRFPIPD